MSENTFSDTSTTYVPPGSASSQVLNATPGLLNVHKSLLGSSATETNDQNGKKDDVMFTHVHASIRTTMHEKEEFDEYPNVAGVIKDYEDPLLDELFS